MAMTIEERPDSTVVTGLEDLPDWGIEMHSDGAVTLRPPTGESVTATVWRKVPIAAAMRAARDARGEGLARTIAELINSEGVRPSKSSRGDTDAHLARVAAVYRIALDHEVSPPQVLAATFGTAEVSTNRWIMNAQARGLLGSHAEESAATRPATSVPEAWRRLTLHPISKRRDG